MGTAGTLFDAPADARKLQSLRVEGLRNPAVGTVYPDGVLEQGGMPLGGLGTGYICLDPSGRLGKTSIFNRFPAPIVLNQPFLFLAFGDRRLTLATPKDGIGDVRAVRYFGHFPVADVVYELDAPVKVELRAFSPFILGDSAECNTPAAVFEVRLTSASDQPQSVTVTLAPGGFPKGDAEAVEAVEAGGWKGIQVKHKPVENLPAGVQHTYALAAETLPSRRFQYLREGKAADEPKATNTLPKVLEPSGGNWGLSVTCELKPGEQAAQRFVLAWHQPHLREASGRVETHQYTKRFANAAAVAAHAIGKREEWLRRILAQQDVLYGSDLPDWLKEELVNVPYTLAKNSTWLAKTRPDDWWGDEGLFLVNESFSTCPLTETMPCRFFGHWPTLFFFPELELITLKAIRTFQLRGGQPPFCFGLGFAIRDPRYHCQHTCGAGEYAQMIYRYYLRTGDAAFLKDFWGSARDSLNFMLWLDRDGDGLVEDHPHVFGQEGFPGNNPLDQWPWYGPSSYTAGKALGALACGIRMAEIVGGTSPSRESRGTEAPPTIGDTPPRIAEQAAAWRAALAKGQTVYDLRLWTGSYYRTYAGDAAHKANDACFSAQLSSVWCTRTLGLDDPLPRDRIEKALETIAKLNISASPFGMVNAVYPDGKVCKEARWSDDVFIQCNATAAMVYLYYGQRETGEKAARAMLDTIFRGPHPMPWSQPCGLSGSTGGTCHGHDYYDHMVVWSYPLTFAGHDIRAACAPGGLIDRLLKTR
ncbi:MAG TPA: GH116 family glycosyl hydrolase [Planctomycetota bacterium]|nr:GH116 family glycosyl hydrolase [Planctomycetota bacterium]HRR79716.1 GH116 family glycosyl hydrolase [Planctomycetota bacterium]HRT93219.1 GH116 family glycosyl hydrolase [Planctomycetota bacterium]